MHRTHILSILFLALAVSSASAADYLSPLDLVAAPDGKTLYVALATGKSVAMFDVASGKVTRTVALPTVLGGIALSPDGSRLYASGAAPKGAVYAIDTKAAKLVGTFAVGHSPEGLAVSPDGKTLYVCNRFNDNLAILALPKGNVVKTVAMAREPVAVAATPDGKHVVVANHLPTGRADGEYVASVVTIVGTGAGNPVVTVKLHNGVVDLRGICVSPDSKYAYATSILAHYQLPTTQIERGWICANSLSVIDVAGAKLVNTVLLDSVDHGAANPWGVMCSPDGKRLCVSHAGTHEISIIDRVGLHERLDRVALGQKVTDVSSSAENVPNDLGFVDHVRRRIQLAGNGPRGLAIVGEKIYAAEYFTDTLGVTGLAPKRRADVQSIPLGPKVALTPVRKGEKNFNDAVLCMQQWQSCASCHPDARTDGLNWDLLNDGIGNGKNAKSMLLAHRTPPVMVSGVRGKAEVAVRAGIRHIQFAIRPEEDATSIDAYLKALQPIPSPYLVDGKLSAAAQRGEKLFRTAGCSGCHSGELGTGLQSFDVGNGPDQQGVKEFDTPTVVEVWRTAPYLYDGRAATIIDVLTTFNKGDKHGTTSNLSKQQIADLAEYVLSR
ncbi:beta-propeller fold lactonase family protein [bacterium]|nr:beta-propeller fold lactonase family protein [bacterium]